MTALSLDRHCDGHQAVPVDGSWYSERTLHPANLKHEFAYPVVAVCDRCGTRIRLGSPDEAEWSHVAAGPEARATAESA